VVPEVTGFNVVVGSTTPETEHVSPFLGFSLIIIVFEATFMIAFL
jgi:hypothetical protein